MAHEHYFKDYKNEEFNLDTLDRQIEIVSILKKVENIIELRRQEIEKLDDLIKSRFENHKIMSDYCSP